MYPGYFNIIASPKELSWVFHSADLVFVEEKGAWLCVRVSMGVCVCAYQSDIRAEVFTNTQANMEANAQAARRLTHRLTRRLTA